MNEIVSVNVNQAFSEGFWKLRSYGLKESSRAGPVLVAPGPVMTSYSSPRERVLFNPVRDANHVFHLMEAIWMLAGGQNVEWLLPFNSSFGQFAEPNHFMHGAYGHRWRHHFGFDQIQSIVNRLKSNPDDRQAVMQMWDCAEGNDLNGNWKDRPCNTHIFFDCRSGRLNMTVCCRSNDMIWGAYGSNVVHFSVLQEVMAHGIGVPVGIYRQFSNNFHVYTDLPMVKQLLETPPFEQYDYYKDSNIAAYPLITQTESMADFLLDCEDFVLEKNTVLRTHFMQHIAWPLKQAYILRKLGNPTDAWRSYLEEIPPDCDWRRGFEEWTIRRMK